MRFSRIDVAVRFLANHDALLARARIRFAQFDGFFAALPRVVRKCLAVLVPVESRPALKLYFDGRGLYFDALTAWHIKDNRFRFRQNLAGQRVHHGVFLRAKLAGRNELQIAEAPGVARVHAIGYEFAGIRRPKHSRALLDVLRSLRDQRPERGNRHGVVVGGFAVARQTNHFAGRDIADVQVVVLDVGDPLFVRRSVFILTCDGLGPPLALVILKPAGPRRTVYLERNGFSILGEINRVKRKRRWLNFASERLGKRTGKARVVKSRADAVLVGINEKKLRAIRSRFVIPEAIFLGDPMRRHLSQVDAMTQIPREELLSAMIVLTRPLRHAPRGTKERYNREAKPAVRMDLHRDSSSLGTCSPLAFRLSAAFVLLLLIIRWTNKCHGSDALIEQRAIEGRELFLNEVLITALCVSKFFLNGEVGTGAGDVAGGVDNPPTDTAAALLETIEKELADAESSYQNLIEKELPAFNRALLDKGITPVAFVRPPNDEEEEDEGGG